MGTRKFLTEGLSPYSKRVTEETQKFAYGRPARSNEDQILFVYPFYTIYIVAPFALFQEYIVARSLWMTLLEISLVIMVLAMIRVTRWKIANWLFIILILFSILWYHSVRPVINGNPSVLVALFISIAFLAIWQEMDPLAGFLLALTTIKPQMVILLIPFVILWAISRKRWTLILSFLGSMAILIFSGTLLVLDWIMQNLRQVLSYSGYTLPGTPGAIFAEWLPGVGIQLGWLLTLIFILILLLEWRNAYKKEYQWFLWTACLTLVITNLIGIRTATANYVALFPALILILSILDNRWGRNGRIIILVSLTLLFFGLWWLFISTLTISDQPIQHPILFFPLPVLLLIGLYWTRWQAIKSPSALLEEYRIVNKIGDI
jgi:hypothetical protein